MDEREASIDRTVRELVELAASSGLTVSTAESCTAGMVASAIAGVPGASSVLRGGAVTYVNDIKHRVLGVSSETLDGVGAVSSDCARQMAEGSLRLFESDAAVSVTGFAGPGGGTPEEPVGTVYIGIATDLEARAERFSFDGDRDTVRKMACRAACRLLLEACRSLAGTR